MPYEVDFLVAGEARSTVVDAPDAAAAVTAVMVTHRHERFELLLVRPAGTRTSTGAPVDPVASPASADEP
jgi:hypothetical protein